MKRTLEITFKFFNQQVRTKE